MLYRQSDQNKVGFLNDKKEEIPLAKVDKIDNKVIEAQKSKNLNSKFDPENIYGSKGNSIRSAMAGGITDIGGPKKQIRTSEVGSIWGDEEKQIIDNGEKIREEKQAISDYRKQDREQKTADLTQESQDIDLRKDSEISKTGTYSGSSYKMPQNGMSIFDDVFDFSRMPEKTTGEKNQDTDI